MSGLLLGLVKHCAAVDFMYFGQVLDRPFPGQDDLDWHEDDDAELSGGMYATEAESREQVSDFYRRVWAHSDAAIAELPLDARGTVPWWPEDSRHPTLHTLLVHTIQDLAVVLAVLTADGCEEPELAGTTDRRGAIGGTELGVDAADVRADRV